MYSSFPSDLPQQHDPTYLPLPFNTHSAPGSITSSPTTPLPHPFPYGLFGPQPMQPPMQPPHGPSTSPPSSSHMSGGYTSIPGLNHVPPGFSFGPMNPSMAMGLNGSSSASAASSASAGVGSQAQPVPYHFPSLYQQQQGHGPPANHVASSGSISSNGSGSSTSISHLPYGMMDFHGSYSGLPAARTASNSSAPASTNAGAMNGSSANRSVRRRCDRCFKMHRKCDGQLPCSQCRRSRSSSTQCTYSQLGITQHAKLLPHQQQQHQHQHQHQHHQAIPGRHSAASHADGIRFPPSPDNAVVDSFFGDSLRLPSSSQVAAMAGQSAYNLHAAPSNGHAHHGPVANGVHNGIANGIHSGPAHAAFQDAETVGSVSGTLQRMEEYAGLCVAAQLVYVTRPDLFHYLSPMLAQHYLASATSSQSPSAFSLTSSSTTVATNAGSASSAGSQAALPSQFHQFAQMLLHRSQSAQDRVSGRELRDMLVRMPAECQRVLQATHAVDSRAAVSGRLFAKVASLLRQHRMQPSSPSSYDRHTSPAEYGDSARYAMIAWHHPQPMVQLRQTELLGQILESFPFALVDDTFCDEFRWQRDAVFAVAVHAGSVIKCEDMLNMRIRIAVELSSQLDTAETTVARNGYASACERLCSSAAGEKFRIVDVGVVHCMCGDGTFRTVPATLVVFCNPFGLPVLEVACFRV